MRSAHSPSDRLSITGGIATVILGVVLAVTILAVAEAETRWLFYFAAGIAFAAIFAVIPSKESFLWIVFVLSLQIDVSIRILHGHAGTPGLNFQLPFLIGLLLVAWHAVSGRLRPVRWIGPLAFPIGALFLTMLVSVLTSAEQFTGVATVIIQLELYMIYWLALNCVRSEEALVRTVKLLLWVLAIQSVIYYVQNALGITFSPTGELRSAGSLPRPGGTVATHPSGFGTFIIPLLLIAVAHFLTRNAALLGARLCGLFIVLGTGALVLTLTRASWAAFGLGLVWIAYFTYLQRILNLRRVIAVIAVALVAVAAATPRIAARLESAPFESSYRERYALMQMAIRVIAEHPFTGVGAGAYDHTYKAYLTPALAEKWQSTVHNHYLLRTAETGIPGGIAFVLVLFYGFRQTVRLGKSSNQLVRTVAIGCGGAILAECFAMYWDIWSFFTVQSLFWFLLGLMGAAEIMQRKGAHRDKPSNRPELSAKANRLATPT